jgi:extradiol dioxygenase family protein
MLEQTGRRRYQSKEQTSEGRMKRFHVHVSVDDLDESVRFYSTLFAAGPSVRQSDYAKWMLEDHLIGRAIPQQAARQGTPARRRSSG